MEESFKKFKPKLIEIKNEYRDKIYKEINNYYTNNNMLNELNELDESEIKLFKDASNIFEDENFTNDVKNYINLNKLSNAIIGYLN